MVHELWFASVHREPGLRPSLGNWTPLRGTHFCYNAGERPKRAMAIDQVESAESQPRLRWYQFSVRDMLLLTTFVAIFFSILAVGWSHRVYIARIELKRRPLESTKELPHADFRYHEAVQDSAIETAQSDSMMELIVRSLRQERIEKIEGVKIDVKVVRKHVSLEDCACSCDITASSNDAIVSEKLVRTFYQVFSQTVPEVTPVVRERYRERARTAFTTSGSPAEDKSWWGSDLHDFESRWLAIERQHAEGEQPSETRSMSFYFNRLGGLRDSVPVWPTSPYMSSCVLLADFWLALGIGVLINRWRRCR
jgi:hypothetical protein